MTDIPNLGERLKADRLARKMGRREYSELVGLTQAKIANLEKGRAPKDDELEKLAHLAFVEPATDATTEGPATAAPIAADAGPSVTSSDDAFTRYQTEKAALIARYTEVYNRLDGRPSAIPYSPFWGSPGEGPVESYARILQWCDEVDAWLDSIAAQEEGNVDTVEVTTSGATIINFPEQELVGDGSGEALPPIEGHETEERTWEPDGVHVVDELDEIAEEETFLANVTEPDWEFEDDGIRRISNGELKTLKRCRRKWWLAYYRRLGLPVHAVTGAAQLGTRIHRCLAVYYVPAGQQPGDPFAELERTFQEDLLTVGSDEFKVADLVKERDLAHAMLEGYFEWLAETAADQGIEVVAPETKLEVDAMMPSGEVHLIAKLDVRITRTFGTDVARLFIDHKTVGDLTNPTKMLTFDEQMLHYDLCEYLDLLQSGMATEEAEVVRTDGALYNMLRKVKRTAQAKPPFYGRVEVRHNIHTLRSYWLRVKGEIDEILALEAKLAAGEDPRQVAYPTPTRDCSWDCDFYHVCTMFDDGSRSEDMLAATYVEVNPLKRYEATAEGKTL